MIKHKHQQLFDLLRDELQRGTWACNSKLPNLKELARRYNVSINVASKAVEMLKQEDLVSVKAGTGIHSRTPVRNEIVEFRYSGDRLFGVYSRSKKLNILIEDNAEWQIVFWNSFFEKIAEDNPDIELTVGYNLSGKKHERKFDLALGSLDFLTQMGFSPETTMPAATMKEFYGDVYSDLLLKPAHFNFSGEEHYLPFGFINYKLLTRMSISEPAAEENILDYIERLAAGSKSPLGYFICSGRSLLANSGLQFFNSSAGELKMPSAEKLVTVFKRARKLYQDGHLIWLHGNFSDHKAIYAMPKEQAIHITEYPFNSNSKDEQKKLMDQGLKLVRHPAGNHLLIVPEVAAISNECHFPEECLRIINKLLMPNIQKQLRKHNIAQPIHPALLEEDSYLADELKRTRDLKFAIPNSQVTDAFSYFIGWEFFYYLKGRRQDEVVDFINKKIKYYFAVHQKFKKL